MLIYFYLSPVLGEMLDPLERRDQLQRHKSLLVTLHVLQEKLVLRDVSVREVELDLLDNLRANLIGRDFNWRFYGLLRLPVTLSRLL